MLKIFLLIALGYRALDRCTKHSENVISSKAVSNSCDPFCENFCPKWKGNVARGVCGIQANNPACYRAVAIEGDEYTKLRLCEVKECIECIGYINNGGFCYCSFDFYDNDQQAPLNLLHKQFYCNWFHTL